MRAGSLLTAVVGILALTLSAPASAQKKSEPGTFDYYVLSLSWSPAYCARHGAADGADQCSASKPYGFIVHGLWPQFADGSYPRACSRAQPIPKRVVDETATVMPDVGLIVHEWQQHGTCSGMSAPDYFTKVRDAFARITIPSDLAAPKPGLSIPADQVRARFVAANRGLSADMIALTCQRKVLTDVRICLNKDLQFQTCGKGVVDRCGNDGTLAVAQP